MASTIPDAGEVLGTTATAVHEHHSDLWAELTLKENELLRAVAVAGDFTAARDDFVSFLRGEVAEHLQAEQTVLLEIAETGLQAAMAARSLVLLFALRMEKEESVLLPVLREAGVDVDALLAGKSEITGQHGQPR